MKLIFIITLPIITLSTFFFWKQLYQRKQPKSGIIIILNGPSASGKSSIQKEFQTLMMPNLWIKLGIDTLFDTPMPNITSENISYWQKENPIRWCTQTTDADKNPIVTLFTGIQGDTVAYGMNSAIAAYAKSGCNCIIDYIGYKKEWTNDLIKKLKGIKTYWVKINIPLKIVEQREALRSTSPKGHARSHYHTVHWDIAYDLEINSEQSNPQEIASIIKEKLNL